MLYRCGTSVKSSFSNFRLITKVMSSKAQRLQDPVVNEFKTRKDQRYCFEESISKTVPSMKCKKINHEKTNDDSKGCASELTELLCDKLSQDEKKIYFAHKHAVMIGQSSYIDPFTGYTVFTEEFLKKRKTCCGSGCRHCPYKQEKVPEGKRKEFNSAFFT